MIDLHIHILPGMDDGPADLEETLEMCRLCVEDGIRILAATPHMIREVYDNGREEILAAVAALRETLAKQGTDLDVRPGADVRLDYDLVDRLDRGELVTLNDGGRFLLLEFPDTLHGRDTARTVAALKQRGITPILSHPERNPYFLENPEALYDLVHSDVLLQVTARSLMGGFGRDVQRFAERLLERRLVHLLASDAHAPDARRPGLRDAARRAGERMGDEEARRLVEGNPALILQGALPDIPTPLPWKGTRKAWWRLRG